MYDFPLIEDSNFDLNRASLLRISPVFKHQLSHQIIAAKFHIYITSSRVTGHGSRDILPIAIDDLHHYPIPRLIDRFVQQELLPEIKKIQK
jgi:hypothetical protein